MQVVSDDDSLAPEPKFFLSRPTVAKLQVLNQTALQLLTTGEDQTAPFVVCHTLNSNVCQLRLPAWTSAMSSRER